MKKYIFIAAAALLAVCACSKKDAISPEQAQQEITFMTANYVTKAVSGAEFTGTAFGTYAWSAATVGSYFMNNEKITKASDGAWKPATTYYWPKNASVDFISYYPYNCSALTVEQNKLTYASYDVAAGQEDLMYADKAVGYGSNVNEVLDGVNDARNGVPTFFRHALAKLSINVKLAYYQKTESETNTVTRWTVTVNSAKLVGVNMKGGVVLDLASTPTTGIVPWVKPAGEVWTADGAAMADKSLTAPGALSTSEVSLLSGYYVMPQALTAGTQKLVLNLTVDTYRKVGTAAEEHFLSETFDANANLFIATSLESWKMSDNITYNIIVAPTKGSGNGDNPFDPTDPNFDPEDPDLSNVTISFDPAVESWNSVLVTGNIVI